MPDSPSEQNLALLEAPLKRAGLAIIASAPWAEALTQSLAGRAQFYSIDAQTGGPAFVVVKLPVEAP